MRMENGVALLLEYIIHVCVQVFYHIGNLCIQRMAFINVIKGCIICFCQNNHVGNNISVFLRMGIAPLQLFPKLHLRF